MPKTWNRVGPISKTNIMKKFLASVVLLAMCWQANYAQVNFGITVGSSIANMQLQDGGEKDQLNYRTGFSAGVYSDIAISKNFFIQPALNFVQKGCKETEEFQGETIKSVVNLNCLEIPLNLVFKFPGSAGRLFLGAGPSIAYVLSGKQKISSGGSSESEKINIGNNETDDIKPFDAGANFLVGFEFKNGVSISSNYNLGLSNLTTTSAENSSTKNSYIGVKVGYQF
jgi:hypothetical protein